MDTQSIRIMVVEDEELLLTAITKKLNLEQIDTVPYASGKDAIDALHGMETPPDAIWLDYHLKDMDGLFFMNEMRKDERFAKVPVFVISNSASQENVDGMLALGAEKYFLKAEHRLEDLIRMIKTYILEQKTKS